MYFEPEKTRSHNALFNYVLGIRGCGKTYSMLKWCVERYIKTGERFVYLRRSEEELKKLTTQKNGRLFNHVQKEFEGHALWAEANVLHIDKQICGYASALSTAGKLKSDALDNVTTIVFDEFIINKLITQQRYLPDEVTAFNEFYETVARPGSRDYDVYCWFLGNAVSSSNPYFDFFDLHVPYQGSVYKRGDSLVQLVAPQDLVEVKKNTRFYKMLEGTSYEKYAVENKFLTDSQHFIKKKSKSSEYQFTLLYYDDCIGVWKDYRNGWYHISDDVDKQCRFVYATTTETQQPNTLLLKGAKNSYNLKGLKQAYELGCVYYENQRLYNWFRDIVRMGF